MKKVTVAEIEPLLTELSGNIAAVARKLGVSRGTIHNRIDESPVLRAKLEDARETMIDNAEGMLYKKIRDGDTVALIFFLKTQGRRRGYSERIEHTGGDGGPITVHVVYDHDAAGVDSE